MLAKEETSLPTKETISKCQRVLDMAFELCADIEIERLEANLHNYLNRVEKWCKCRHRK